MADGLPCTFHRAFDRIKDKEEALEDVIGCGFATILTSGGEHPAMEGLSKLKLIQEQADERITILVGGGVRSTNAGELKKIFWLYTFSLYYRRYRKYRCQRAESYKRSNSVGYDQLSLFWR